METDNSRSAIELRRRQNTLIIVGTGTIIFGIWSIVKTVGILVIGKNERLPVLKQMIESNGAEWEDRYYTAAIILAVIILAVDLVFRVFIGWAAISEGRGKRRSVLYIIIACLILWSSIWTITGISSEYVNYLMRLTSVTPEAQLKDPSLSAIIIEATSFIMLAEMVHAAIRVRKLTRESGKHMKHVRTGKHGR